MFFIPVIKNVSKCVLLSFLIVVILPFKSVFALLTTYESFIVQDLHKVELIGDNLGGQFGASLARGDFNDDGIEDLVVGAPFASTGLSEWNGQVVIIFGQEVFKERTIDFSIMSPSVVIYGQHSGDQFGTAIEVGDYNGDGYDDLVVSASNAYEDSERPGKVYVFYGGSRSVLKNNTSIDLSVQKPDSLFVGYSDKDTFGLSLKTLDLNDDKVDDLLIGAPETKAYDIDNCGAVYGFLGSSGKFFPSFKLKKTSADITFYGQTGGERFGSSISGGHFLGYKINDVAIGAYNADVDGVKHVGKVYIYKGGTGFSSVVRVPSLTIQGTVNNEWFGFSLDSSDVNKDGLDDFAITSFPYLSTRNDGKAFVFYGGTKFSQEGIIYKSSEVKDVVVENPKGEAFLGSSIQLGDMNKDGLSDIVIGAPGIGNPISQYPGDVYAAYSNVGGLSSEYSISDDRITSQIHGENADDWFGYSIKILDFNNDGYEDLAIGSRYSDTELGVNTGKVFVLLSDGIPFGTAKEVVESQDMPITRGEFLKIVFDKFNLSEIKKDYLNDCKEHLEFCLFNFTAVSTYNDIEFSPELSLYPDVSPSNEYYDYINMGTMLGLLNGFTGEKDSPFHPERYISRIQALKIIFGAVGLVPPKYRFELVALLGSLQKIEDQFSYFNDVSSQISYMWWYPRYVNFAYESGIVDQTQYFRPDENITIKEFEYMLNKTLEFIENQNGEN